MRILPDTSSPERFALVLMLSLATVLVVIATPPGETPRTVALLFQGLAFITALIAAGGARHTGARPVSMLVMALFAVCVLSAVGIVDDDARIVVSLALAVATPSVMIRGLARLLRERGVVAQSVFGALALYLQIGLIFAFAAAGIGLVQDTPFFVGEATATISDFVYFSFTTMSTTGYGDLTPAEPLGRSLAVFEMLIGQVYLVTIVGLLIGNMGRPRHAAP